MCLEIRSMQPSHVAVIEASVSDKSTPGEVLPRISSVKHDVAVVIRTSCNHLALGILSFCHAQRQNKM